MSFSSSFDVDPDTLTYGSATGTPSFDGEADNATHIVTSTGDNTGAVLEVWKWDEETSSWVEASDSGVHDITSQIRTWDILGGASLPVDVVDVPNFVGTRLCDEGNTYGTYNLQLDVPFIGELQYVRIVWRVDPATPNYASLRASRSGVPINVLFNIATGEVVENNAGQTEIISNRELSDNRRETVIRYRSNVRSLTDWTIFPAYAPNTQTGAATSAVGCFDIEALDLDYQRDTCPPVGQAEINFPLTRPFAPAGTEGLMIAYEGNLALNDGGGAIGSASAEDVTKVQFRCPNGGYIEATITATRVSTGGGNLLFTTSEVISNQPGGTDYTFRLEFDDGIARRVGMRATSTLGSESLVFSAANPVTGYEQGPGGINLTLPYVGAWNNNNNASPSAFSFDAATSLEFRTNGNGGTSSAFQLFLIDAPEYGWQSPCDRTASIIDNAGGSTADTNFRFTGVTCWEQQQPVTIGSNTRNVGPAAASPFVASFTVPSNDFTLVNFIANLDGTGSGNFTVTNTATGQTSNTNSVSFSVATTAFPPVVDRTFTTIDTITGNAGDIIAIQSNLTGNTRWRYTLNNGNNGLFRQGTAGTSTSTAVAMAGTINFITVLAKEEHNTYVTEAGDTVYYDTTTDALSDPLGAGLVEVPCDEDNEPDDVKSVSGSQVENTDPLNPVVRDHIKDECYQTDIQSVNEFDIINSGFGSPTVGAQPFGSATPIQFTITEPHGLMEVDIEVATPNAENGTLFVRNSSGTIVAQDNFVSPGGGTFTSEFFFFGNNIQPDTYDVYVGNVTGVATIATVAGGDPVIRVRLAPLEKRIVRTLEGGDLVVVDETANTITPTAALPPPWTPCSEEPKEARPSHIVLPFSPITMDNGGGVGAGEPNPQITGYIMYTEESVFTRFAGAQNVAGANEPNFAAVAWDGTQWKYSDNGQNGTSALVNWISFTPAASDRLIAEVLLGNAAAGGAQFVSAMPPGQTNGIIHVENLGGFTAITGDQFTNGSSNVGEFFLDGSYQPDGFADYATAQLDGTYLVESDGSTLTVDQAIADGWVPRPANLLLLTSPNNTKYAVAVLDDGTLITAAV